MRSRLVLLGAVALAVAAVTFIGVRFASSRDRQTAAVHASLASRQASYLGVYEQGSPAGYAPITGFAKAAGAQPNLIGYFSGWAEPFAASFAQKIHSHDGVTLVQIDPTYASIQGIAAGDYDDYLRSYADSVRAFGHPVVIGFGHEMNAPWYPWGYRHVAPATFVAAWRHVVMLFRGQGADNITWLWTINADRSDTGPVHAWWPGPGYVNWVGIDGYYYRPSDRFASVFGHTIDQVRVFTRKPVLLSETAVGPAAGQPAKIRDLFAGMHRYKTLGLVWFDIMQHQGIYHQDWRLEGDRPAEAAFRLGVHDELSQESS